MTNNASVDDELVRDSQISGISAVKERLAFCCCRLFNKSSQYDLSSSSKRFNENEQKASSETYVIQAEQRARQDKLERIAASLPGLSLDQNHKQRTLLSTNQTPIRPIAPMRQTTTSSIQRLTPNNANRQRVAPSTVNRQTTPGNSRDEKRHSDDTTDSTEEEASPSEERSSDEEPSSAKRTVAASGQTKNRG